MASKSKALQNLVWNTTRALAAEVDGAIRITRASRGLSVFLGLAEAEIIGRILMEFMTSLTQEDAETIRSSRGFDRTVLAFRSADGAQKIMCTLVPTEDGAVFFGERIFESDLETSKAKSASGRPAPENPARELEELRQQNAYLEALNERLRRDQLLIGSTGFYKRKMLDRLAEAEIARSLRTYRPFALVLCGVDRAQALDQMAGEDARARAIAVVAKAIATRKRAFDSLGHFSPSGLFILQPENDMEGALGFAERIRVSFEGRKIPLDAVDFTVTLSFGCAWFHPTKNHYPGGPELISQAEAALFAAESSGGNRVIQAAPAVALARELEKKPAK